MILKHNAAVERSDPRCKRSSRPARRTRQQAPLPSPEGSDGFPALDSSIPHPANPAYPSAAPSYRSAQHSWSRRRDARDVVPSTRLGCPCTPSLCWRSDFPNWEGRFCRGDICCRRAWFPRPSLPWDLGGYTRKSLGSMDCRDRNGCSGAVPDLFLVSYFTVECRFGEKRSLAITHRSCTSVKNSTHRALSFWAVGWALISRTLA